MLEIKIRVDTDNIIGVKETLADYLSKHGDVKIVDVKEVSMTEQMRLS